MLFLDKSFSLHRWAFCCYFSLMSSFKNCKYVYGLLIKTGRHASKRAAIKRDPALNWDRLLLEALSQAIQTSNGADSDEILLYSKHMAKGLQTKQQLTYM